MTSLLQDYHTASAPCPRPTPLPLSPHPHNSGTSTLRRGIKQQHASELAVPNLGRPACYSLDMCIAATVVPMLYNEHCSYICSRMLVDKQHRRAAPKLTVDVFCMITVLGDT